MPKRRWTGHPLCVSPLRLKVLAGLLLILSCLTDCAQVPIRAEVTAQAQGDARWRVEQASFADLNMSPVQIWVTGTNASQDYLRLFGHADSKCCALVSKALNDATRAHFDAWSAYGFQSIEARTPADREAMKGLLEQLETLQHSETCIGQVQITTVSGPAYRQQREQHFNEMARQAFAAANRLGRPLLLMNREPESAEPLVLPAVTRDGQLLRIHLKAALLQMPSELKTSFTLDGLTQYAGALRDRFAALSRLLEARREVIQTRDVVWAYRYRRQSYRVNYRVPVLEKSTSQALRGLADLESQIQRTRTLLSSMNRLKLLNQNAVLEGERFIRKGLEWIKEARATDEQTLKMLQALDARPGTIQQELKIATQERCEREPPAFTRKLEALDPKQLVSEMVEISRELKTTEGALHEPYRPFDDALVDAFLRAWPATFSSEALEQRYDQWVTERRQLVWDALIQDLANRQVLLVNRELLAQRHPPPELVLPSPPSATSSREEWDNPATGGRSRSSSNLLAGVLHRSNVLFQVSRVEDGYDVIPFFEVQGQFLMVADPAAGLVRYESPRADQFQADHEEVAVMIEQSQQEEKP